MTSMVYRIEYSSSSRSKCKGPKPCAGSQIDKGELRVGRMIEISGHQAFQWSHWGCATPIVLSAIKKSVQNPSNLDGYSDLKPDDKKKVDKAWEEGKVAEEDIPDSAKQPQSDDEDPLERQPKRKKTGAERVAMNDDTRLSSFWPRWSLGPPSRLLQASTSGNSENSADQGKRKQTAFGPPFPISLSSESSASQGKRNQSAFGPPNPISSSTEPSDIGYMKMTSDYRRQAREMFQRLEAHRSDAQMIYVMKLLQNDKNAETFADFIRDSLRRAWVREQIAEAGLE